MRPESQVLVLFQSIHSVTAAKHVLAERGFWLDLVPIPREISSDCGMGLLVDGKIVVDTARPVRKQAWAAFRFDERAFTAASPKRCILLGECGG